MMRLRAMSLGCVCLVLAGCAQAGGRNTSSVHEYRRRALECLKAAIRYRANPAVRTAAVEALESSGHDQAGPWIRTALYDDVPAVRFAACTAVGHLRDHKAAKPVGDLVDDPDANVRAAALFALHRLGDTSRSGFLPGYLLDHDDAVVRRNAAMLLGLLGEPGAIKVLARAMRDPDAGVRHHVLDALARLGNAEAQRELTMMANSGIGSEEVFALTALAATRDRKYADMFRHKLAGAAHMESRLAAARGLGLVGSDEGLSVALHGLNARPARRGGRDDPPEAQRLRLLLLATSALGAIGSREALPRLARKLEKERDPRVQVAVARAILEILSGGDVVGSPFAGAP